MSWVHGCTDVGKSNKNDVYLRNMYKIRLLRHIIAFQSISRAFIDKIKIKQMYPTWRFCGAKGIYRNYHLNCSV